jgi:hypothetical protein
MDAQFERCQAGICVSKGDFKVPVPWLCVSVLCAWLRGVAYPILPVCEIFSGRHCCYFSFFSKFK